MRSEDWSIILIALDGTPIADLTSEARDISMTFRMRGQHEASWTVDGHSSLARATQELTTDVMVTWREWQIARLRVTQSSDDLDTDSHTVTFSAIDYRGMFNRRFGRGAALRNGDTAGIVWMLINWSQTEAVGGGNWGITRHPDIPAITTVSDYETSQGANLKEVFEDLSENVYPGFDWEIDPALMFRVWTFRGTRRAFALEYGGNVTEVKRDVDPSIYANYVYQTGKEGLAPAIRYASDLRTRPEGRIEAAEGNPDLGNTTLIGWAADAYLQRHGTMLPGYQMTVSPGAWSPDQLWLGDSADIIVRSGRLDVQDIERVFEIAVKLDANGVETVDLTFGKLRENLLALVRALPERLDRLNLR